MSLPLLEVRGLRAGYGQGDILHGLDFSIEEGAVTALLGANGAGKTTTLRALTAMIRASGDIRFAGKRLNGRATEDIVREAIAHVPQGRGTITRLSVAENLALGAITRSDHRAVESDIARIYDYFPILWARRHQKAGALSGGEQQMLAIGRALMLRPRLVLLDEPSFGLAPLVVRDVFAILAAVNRKDKVSMLIVEQNAGLALNVASHAYLLETGRIVTGGPASRIRADENIRRVYLGN